MDNKLIRNNSIFKINNLSIIMLFIISTFIVLNNNITLNKMLIIFCVTSMIFYIYDHQKVFMAFLIISCSWGATINLKYRFGNIMPSDLSMVMFTISIIICSLQKKINTNKFFNRIWNIFLLDLIVTFLLLGIIKKYAIYNILQDFKLFLYVFIPYIYLVSINIDENFKNNMLLFIKIYIILIFLQEIKHFVYVGLTSMVNMGFGQRDVGIIVQFIPLAISILLVYKHKYNLLEFILLQVLGFLACLLSFTRTIWIAYIMGILVNIFFKDNKFIKLLKNIMIVFFIIIITHNILIEIMPNIYMNFYDAVVSRITDSTNPTNTLEHRFNSANNVFYDKVWRIDSIFGSGFGEIWETRGTVFIENSLFYYLWKYGLFFTVYLMCLIIKNCYKAFKTKSSLLKVVSLNLFIFICIGNFSGNLNTYYFMPILSFVFAYPIMQRNYNLNRIKEM